MLIAMAIRLILGAVKASVKNPAKAKALKEDLLEVRDAITELYPEE